MMSKLSKSPRALGYRWPAEWERHRATWLVWPHNRQTWPGRFDAARRQFAHFVRTVCRFEMVELLAVEGAYEDAREYLSDLTNCRLHQVPTNDSWIRDHGPIFLNGPASQPLLLLDWQYNAWGNKYPPFDLDNDVPRHVAEITGRQRQEVAMVLEGGSVEGNGAGVVMTTDSCLINSSRNPGWTREQIEGHLREFLCAERVIWLAGEIAGDDTDGHIDQIGRFVNAQTVMLVDYPASNMFAENRRRLERWAGHAGAPLEIVRIKAPTPREVEGMWLPASYANFYLVNGAVLVPTFADDADNEALKVIGECFPERQIVDVPASDLIFGLGALHCLSQQEPAGVP